MGRAVNHRYWIALLALVFSICIISSSAVFAYGKHTGELKNLEELCTLTLIFTLLTGWQVTT